MGESGQEQNEQLIERLTQRIGRWQLTLPALLFLQVTRPLSFIAAQGLLLCEPLLGTLNQDATLVEYADILADRDKLDSLVARLESASHLRSSNAKENG